MSQSKERWKNIKANLQTKIKAKEDKQPMFWFYIWMGLGIGFFFAGWFLGGVIEHNSAVADLQIVFDTLPAECKGYAGIDEQIQEVVRKWNVSNISYGLG